MNSFYFQGQKYIRTVFKKCEIYLLAYFLALAINNPIKGFRLAVTHPSKRLCFRRAYASWTVLLRFGPFNVKKNVRFIDFCRSLHQIPDSTLRPSPFQQYGAQCLCRWYSSLLDQMRKSLPTRTGPKILCRTFLWNTLKTAASVLNIVHVDIIAPVVKISILTTFLVAMTKLI